MTTDGSSGPLELRGVRVTVPDGDARRVILDDLDLTVEPGEIVAITGSSGSGKSSLLAAAGLLRRVEHGQVRIDGVDASALSERRRAALRGANIGIIYQSANLLPSLTAREQLLLAAHINHVPRTVARERADELLDAVSLRARAEQLPVHMSGGERQRVGIARALMANPTVLLADEPTASLDPDLADQIAALLAAQARDRLLATVVVTHDGAPLRHVDRRMHLHEGQLTEKAILAV